MLGGRDWLLIALLSLFVLDFCCLIALVIECAILPPESVMAMEFNPKPKDRPVLETPQQVWKARTTGVSEFDIDGIHYVVTNLPKEYVDYSSWYVRMP